MPSNCLSHQINKIIKTKLWWIWSVSTGPLWAPQKRWKTRSQMPIQRNGQMAGYNGLKRHSHCGSMWALSIPRQEQNFLENNYTIYALYLPENFRKKPLVKPRNKNLGDQNTALKIFIKISAGQTGNWIFFYTQNFVFNVSNANQSPKTTSPISTTNSRHTQYKDSFWHFWTNDWIDEKKETCPLHDGCIW